MTIYHVANQTFTNARTAARFAKATNNELRARHGMDTTIFPRRIVSLYSIKSLTENAAAGVALESPRHIAWVDVDSDKVGYDCAGDVCYYLPMVNA